MVKALVIPAPHDSDGTSAEARSYGASSLRATCILTCGEDRRARRPLARLKMHEDPEAGEHGDKGRGVFIFSAALTSDLKCGSRVWVQVKVQAQSGASGVTEKAVGDLDPQEGSYQVGQPSPTPPSTSEVRPVATSWWRQTAVPVGEATDPEDPWIGQGPGSSAEDKPMSLDLSLPEYLSLAFSWQKFGLIAFFLQVCPECRV